METIVLKKERDTMDAFEKLLKALGEMGQEEKECIFSKMKSECTCPDCPSYNQCAGDKKELLYCFHGRSPECIQEELGCVCPDCPVAAENELVNLYYCTSGSEKEMRARK
ncbi:DUF2769 domain-containing protein [Methanomassiliicoccus luminyensis]|uniref:DUF2769 domain-containing protein n=2 Tax=Methanomassiliicoccus luminyensis TaxID=1080712 RepID=UPI00037BDCFB|nr:DUF2769 domain-containing protein [Methanomassiliicoccus luminyensis]